MLATLNDRTGAFLGIALLASVLLVLWLVIFLATEVSGQERWRRPLLIAFGVLIGVIAISYGGLIVVAE